MRAYIAYDKYIEKEFKSSGVGVPVSLDENVAIAESSRRRNVDSRNEWLLIDIPEREYFFDVDLPMSGQSGAVMSCLSDRKFLNTLFISEGKRLFREMDSRLSGEEGDLLSASNRILDEFCEERREELVRLPSGLDFFTFVNSRCRDRHSGKSSALIYSSGIKGSIYRDHMGERFFLYNAAGDIEVIRSISGRPDGVREIL